MNSQTIFVNTITQKQLNHGDDSHMNAILGQSYTCKGLTLAQFIAPNLFSNFQSDDEEIFTYEVASGIKSFRISQQFLTLDDFLTLLPSIQSDFTFATANKIRNKLQITTSVNWAPRSVAFRKLGFSDAQLKQGLKQNWNCDLYYDFKGPQYIYLRMLGIENSFSPNSVTFKIPLSSTSFGGTIYYENTQIASTQRFIFTSPVSFSNFHFEILNQYFQRARTLNNNDSKQMYYAIQFSIVQDIQ